MWVFNIFLYLMFLSNQPAYQAFKEAGAPCYVYIGGETTDPPPPCFYTEGQ